MDVSTSATMDNPNTYDYINGIVMNPMIFVVILIVILLYVLLFSSLGKSKSPMENTSSYFTEANLEKGRSSPWMTVAIIVVVIFGILAFFQAIQYFFGINVVASVQNLFSNSPQINIGVNQNDSAAMPVSSGPGTIQENAIEKQVFNIPGNYYGYEDAKTLCTAYGARLANYDEIESAYNNGGEWCNYGWSEGQMALFPTQKATYEKLQKIKGHQHDCGRPGINGGYMANPKLKFGVNCYGYKPVMTPEEQDEMNTNPAYPQTEQDLLFEKRVNYWKEHLDDILVSPFNYSNWNMI